MRLLACLAILLAATPAPGRTAAPAEDLRERITTMAGEAGAEVGVVVETLDGARRLAIDETREFHAASTMKVPVMVELYRQASARGLALDEEIPVVNAFRSIVDGSPYSLAVGDDSDAHVYDAVGAKTSYRALCEAMITTSSNLATNVLIERLGVDAIRSTVAALGGDGMNVRRGVEDSKAFEAGLNNTTTAKGLAALMLAIGRGRAVSPRASEEMAAVLKRQKLNDAIPAGLPAGTVVGHKTGGITRISHDAAIVYGDTPYVLVVLTRGIDDPKRSATLIADITRAVHAWVERK